MQIPPRIHRELAERNYVVTKQLGSGAFGDVFAAVDSTSGRAVAIKRVGQLFDDVSTARRALREVRLLRAFCHDNVISLLAVLIGKPNAETFDEIFLVMPLMHGDLAKVIQSSNALGEQHIQTFIYQICRALKYVHSAGGKRTCCVSCWRQKHTHTRARAVVHRDLKPANVLVNANCDVKLCDFGSGRKVQLTMSLCSHTTTLYYRAPEGQRTRLTAHTHVYRAYCLRL